jgi:cytochrome c
MNKTKILGVGVVITIITAIYIAMNPITGAKPIPAGTGEKSTAMVNVTFPASLSDTAQLGKKIYEAKCGACHGENGAGQMGVAPPLIHKIYEPSHHADEAFQRAVKLGVTSHHWPFGDMPPVEGLTVGDVKTIAAYIRALQSANEIN